MSDSQLSFEQMSIATPSGDRIVLVATPKTKIRVGRDRLARLREADRSSDLDEEVIEAIQSRPGAEALLMQCWDGPERSWGFDEELGHDELIALGYHVMRGQLKLFRRALCLGVTALCSTDLAPRDFDAVLDGWRRVGKELRDKLELERNLKEEADLFLLDHFSLWTTRPLEEFRLDALPSVFELAERHRDKINQLRERLMERERDMLA